MLFIQSIAIAEEQKLIYGLDNNNFLYIWDLATILQEHNTTIQSKFDFIDYSSQNTLVYRANNKMNIPKIKPKQLLLENGNLYLIALNKLYYLQEQNYQSVDQWKSLIELASYKHEISFIKIRSPYLIIAVDQMLYFMDIQNQFNLVRQIDILSTINNNIVTLVPINSVKITCVTHIGQDEYAIGSDIGIIKQDKLRYVLKHNNNNDLCLSQVTQLIYIEDTQQLISLHQDYLMIWNLILGQETYVKLSNQFHQIAYSDGMIFAAMDNRIILVCKIAQIPNIQNGESLKTLHNSSDVIFQLTTYTQDSKTYLFANGMSPFIDLYIDKSFTLTLSCL